MLAMLVFCVAMQAEPGYCRVKVITAQNAYINNKPLKGNMLVDCNIKVNVKQGGVLVIKNVDNGNFYAIYRSGKIKDLMNQKKHTFLKVVEAYFSSLRSKRSEVNEWCYGGVYRDLFSNDDDVELAIKSLYETLAENGADENTPITIVGIDEK